MTTSQTLGVLEDQQTDFAPGLEKLFTFIPSERAYYIDDIDGEVPSYLSGSYYLNGPAAFSKGNLQYRHWLDGDGMVCRLRFDERGVHFTNRFVRTAKYTTEEA